MNNEPSTVQQETEFVWRRLSEALHLFGKEMDGRVWLAILIPVLIAALVYVVLMYVRDSRTVGWAWATFLGALRCLVYGILATVFLLPSLQTYEKTQTTAKVIVLLDVSGSTDVKDDLPTEAMPLEKLLTRQDKVIRFLTDDQVAFLKRLQDKNPVAVYRFGGRLDSEYQAFDNGQPWTAEQWNNWLKPDAKMPRPEHLNAEESKRFDDKMHLYGELVNSTNVPEALLQTINRESNNRLQGIIVVSDGRSTQFSAQTFDDVVARAAKAKIPIFTVGVGEQRQPINIRITDLQVPDQARPDDRFMVRVEVDGEGKAGEEVAVNLDLFGPKANPAKDKPSYQLTQSGKFSKEGQPPHAQVEFQIDPAQVPAELRNPEAPPEKPELLEGEWKFRARVAKDKREIFVGQEHVTDPAAVQVVKKPIRILLWANGPTRDYQFCRTLFVREADRKRAEVSIRLQLGREGIVQDVPAERLLKEFPTALADEDSEDKFGNLSQYDLIIAFDPDWMELSPEQAALLEKWVGTHAGGFIFVAGPVNTNQLVRSIYAEKFRAILNLLPVRLDDNRLREGIDRPTNQPYRLHFPGASKETAFLKLQEEGDDPLAGWEEFFTGCKTAEEGKGQPLLHGFYSYYPVIQKKPGATVVATYADDTARLKDQSEQPYIVTMPYGAGKVVYISSGETWRLRQEHEAFHERFWTKLARYAGSGNLNRLNRHGTIIMSRTFRADQYVQVNAQLFGRNMEPLGQNVTPKLTIKPPAGVHLEQTKMIMHAKAGSAKDVNGYFEARFLVTSPGTYELQLPVPETSEILTNKFVVKEANPELDNTMPDFEQLRLLASDATDVLNRINDEARARVRAELERTNSNSDKPRLFFDLGAAKVVPDCMVQDIRPQKIRGPIRDLWDDGFAITQDDPPLKISYVLLVIVGLLSIEWLTRKLLKLA